MILDCFMNAEVLGQKHRPGKDHLQRSTRMESWIGSGRIRNVAVARASELSLRVSYGMAGCY